MLFSSSDAVTWTEQPANLDAENGSSLRGVVYGGQHFFGLSTSGRLLVSDDGERWTATDFDELRAPSDVTYGDGRYLLVGSGAPQFSTDGVTWAPAPLDPFEACAKTSPCPQAPSRQPRTRGSARYG